MHLAQNSVNTTFHYYHGRTDTGTQFQANINSNCHAHPKPARLRSGYIQNSYNHISADACSYKCSNTRGDGAPH